MVWNVEQSFYEKLILKFRKHTAKLPMLIRYGVGENEFGVAPLRAPKWYKRPAGASFGFGGKLVAFRPRPSAAVTEDSLVSRSSEFEAAIQNGERSLLRVLCEKKSQETKSLRTDHEGKSYVELLQDLMEKTIVLALATGQKQFSASLCKLVEKYAEILASQGLLTTAMEYLKLLGSNELSPELVILRDRIALATEPGM
nr:protein transport protein sec31 like b [Quercus suber]